MGAKAESDADIVSTLKKSLEQLKSAGAQRHDLVTVETLIKGVEEGLEKVNRKAVVENATKCRDEIVRIWDKIIGGLIADAKEFIKEARLLKANVLHAEELLGQSQVEANAKKYARAVELAKQSRQSATDALELLMTEKRSAAETLVKGFEKQCEKAKDFNVLIMHGAECAKEKKYQIALDFYQQAVEELNKLQTKYENAQKLVEAANVKLAFLNDDELAKSGEKVDYHRAKEMLVKAEHALRKGDFTLVEKCIGDSEGETAAAKAAHERAIVAMGEAEDKAKDVGRLGVSSEKLEESLTRAHAQFKAGNYEGAIVAARDASNEVDKLKKAIEDAKNAITTAQAMINRASQMGIDVMPAKDELQKAKEFTLKGDVVGTKVQAEHAAALAENAITATLNDAIAEVERKVIEAEQQAFKTGTVRQSLDYARQLVKDKLYEEVVPALKKVSFETKGMMHDMKDAQENLNSMQSRLTTLIRLGANITSVQAKRLEAKTAFEARQYTKAAQLSASCNEEAEALLKSKLSENLLKTKELLDSAKKFKVDLSGLEDTLGDSVAEYKGKKYDKSAEKWKECVDKIKEKMMARATELFSAMDLLVSESDKMATRGKAGEIVDLRKKALDCMQDGNYIQMLELLDQIKEEMEIIGERKCAEIILSTQAMISDARSSRVDVAESEEKLERSKDAYQKKQYESSFELAKNARMLIESKMQTYEKAKDAVTIVQEKLEAALKQGFEVAGAKALVKSAEEALVMSDFSQAYVLSEKAKNEIDKLCDRKVFEEIASMGAAASEIAKSGGDPRVVKNLIEDADNARKKKNFIKALELAQAAKPAVERELARAKAKAAIDAAESSIARREKYNMDTSDSKRYLDSARRYYGEDDFEKASSYAQAALNEAPSVAQTSTSHSQTTKAQPAAMQAKVNIEQGKIYLVKEDAPKQIYKMFEESVRSRRLGLCISRTVIDDLKKKCNIGQSQFIWLTMLTQADNWMRAERTEAPVGIVGLKTASSEGEGTNAPNDLSGLAEKIKAFADSKDKIVMLDCLDYLITQNDYKEVLRFVQLMSEHISITKGSMLVALDPIALDTRELKLLERETVPL